MGGVAQGHMCQTLRVIQSCGIRLNPVASVFVKQTELAAQAPGVSLKFFEAHDPTQLDTALASIDKERSGAVLLTPIPYSSPKERL
jgi:hypothetical protein